MINWSVIVQAVLSSIGGATGVTLIILRFAKKRIEALIDQSIQYQLEKRIEIFKHDLNKQYSRFEAYSEKFDDCIDEIIMQLNQSVEILNKIQDRIINCLNENVTLHFILKANDNELLCENLKAIIEKIYHSDTEYSIFLPDSINAKLKDVTKLILDYLGSIDSQLDSLQTSQEILQTIFEVGNISLEKIRFVSEAIKKEKYCQMGESKGG